MIFNKRIKSLKYQGPFGFAIVLLAQCYVFFKYAIFNARYYISREYKKVFGKRINLDSPKTLNEKIQWNKLFYRDPLIVKCADKFSVREYVSNFIGDKYLVPLLFHTKDYKLIKPENFPDFPIVIKASHTSGTRHLIRNKNEINWKVIQTDCRWWLNLNYYYPYK